MATSRPSWRKAQKVGEATFALDPHLLLETWLPNASAPFILTPASNSSACVHSSCYALARTRTRVHVTRTRTRGWGGRSPAAAAHDRTGRCQHVCARSDVQGSSRRAHLEEEVAAREQQPARRREHATRAPGRQRMRGFSSGRSSARRRRPRRDCCRPAARVEVLDAHAERAARARARGARRHDKQQSR